MIVHADSRLVIDWTQMPTYNTIMAVAAGAGLLTIVWFAWELARGRRTPNIDGWALALAVPGVVLVISGVHMTLTWPFAKYFPFDNIIFGEPSFAFGVLLVVAAFYLWRRSALIEAAPRPVAYLASAARPMSVFIIGMGLSLIAICFAGLIFQLFAAPPEEPITGAFAQYPWLEATFMSLLFGFIGLGAVLFPFSLAAAERGTAITGLQWVVGILWGVMGLAFLLFGALNFFTHIGLIINTMG